MSNYAAIIIRHVGLRDYLSKSILKSNPMAGGVKAFEIGLSKLIVLVIGLFAKLIGLGDLLFKRELKPEGKSGANLIVVGSEYKDFYG